MLHFHRLVVYVFIRAVLYGWDSPSILLDLEHTSFALSVCQKKRDLFKRSRFLMLHSYFEIKKIVNPIPVGRHEKVNVVVRKFADVILHRNREV